MIRVEVDCDRDALLFLVEPAGPACHRGTESCFGDRPFSLEGLEGVIAKRASGAAESSYTRRLLEEQDLRHRKVLEEAQELVEATERDHARWEAADVLYHVLVELRARKLSLEDVVAELEARRK